MNVDRLRAALKKNDAKAVRRLISADPKFLKENPDFAAQMLSWALRNIDVAGSMTVRGAEARKQLATLRGTFDALIEAGASVNCPGGLEDLPPLLVAVQMVDSLFAEELLRLGADVNQNVLGFTPMSLTESAEMKEVLRKFGAKP